MKKLGFLLLAFVWMSSDALAIYQPGWERPIKQADLEELKREPRNGVFFDLIMNKRDGARRAATSFTLVKNRPVYCITSPCPPLKSKSQFVVYRVMPAGCGSKKFWAYEVSEKPDWFVYRPRFLKVVDHSTRLCKDLRKYEWEVTLYGKRGNKRYFGGNPEPVFTIQ